MLLHSLENNLDPDWDAGNERSVGLARKLAYTPQGSYSIYVVVASRILAAVAQVGLKIKRFFGE